MLAPEDIQRTWSARVPLRTDQWGSPVQVPSGSFWPGHLPSADGFRSEPGAILASGGVTGMISAKPRFAQETKSGLARGIARSAARSCSWAIDGAVFPASASIGSTRVGLTSTTGLQMLNG